MVISHKSSEEIRLESRPERARCVKANNQELIGNFQKSDGTTLCRVPMDESFIYLKRKL